MAWFSSTSPSSTPRSTASHVAGRRRCRAAMGCQRLHDRLCRLHSHRGRAGRPHRRQAGFHGGLCHLHRGLGRLCAGARRHHPDRGKRRPGIGRGDPGSELAGVAQPCLSGRKAARPRGRHWAAGASLALTAGPLVGGALIALVGWRSIFLVNLPIGLAGLWLSWRYAGETTRSPQREIDLPGQLAAIAALGCLAGAIIEGGALGWSHPLVIAGFAASAVLAMLFVCAGAARAATDAAAVAVHPSDVRADIAGRPSRQCRLLRTDLRLQPVFPARQRMVAVRRPGLPSCR